MSENPLYFKTGVPTPGLQPSVGPHPIQNRAMEVEVSVCMCEAAFVKVVHKCAKPSYLPFAANTITSATPPSRKGGVPLL